MIRIASRFQRSVAIELDWDDPSALDGYVVSPVVRESADRVLAGLQSDRATRAWSLVGPYGTGKSSFGLFLAKLLADGAQSKGRRKQNSARAVFAKQLKSKKLRGGLVPVLMSGERAPLSTVVLSGLDRAAALFKGKGAAKLRRRIGDLRGLTDSGKTPTGDQVCGCVEELAKLATINGGSGLFLVFDEVGKCLEHAAGQTAGRDIFLLQQLAEFVTRSREANIGLIVVLHQGLAAYAEGLSAAEQSEWRKIEGRFEEIAFLEPAEQLVILAGQAIDSSGVRDRGLRDNLKRRIEQVLEIREVRSAAGLRKGLESCFPISPESALILGSIFRGALSQNQRSLFAFLTGAEQGGLQRFLEGETSKGTSKLTRLYDAADLFDYVSGLLATRPKSRIHERTWSIAEQAIAARQSREDEFSARLIKVVAVLERFGGDVGVRATPPLLASVLDVSVEEVEAAIADLKSILVVRRHSNSVHLWDGAEVDIEKVISDARAQVVAAGNAVESLRRHLTLRPVVGGRHLHETGTLRWLEPRLVDDSAISVETPQVPSEPGNGLVLYVLPTSTRRAKQLGEWLKDPKFRSHALPHPATVVALPTHSKALFSQAAEMVALDRALKSGSAVDLDPAARRELSVRLADAKSRVSSGLASTFGWSGGAASASAKWLTSVGGEVECGRLSQLASDVFEKAFPDSPRIHNELVNRDRLSSNAAKARRELLSRMIPRGTEPNLGIEGHPPELSLYLSVLHSSGIHHDEGGWGWRAPQAGTPMYPLWCAILNTLEHAAKPMSVEQLFLTLSNPPVGARGGALPIVLMAVLLVESERISVFEDGSLVPVLDPPIVERLLARPGSFTLRAYPVDGEHVKFLAAAARGVDPDAPPAPTALSFVKLLLRRYRRLPNYALKSAEVGGNGKRLRAAIEAARDPQAFVFEQLPVSLEFASGVLPSARAFAKALRDAFADLDGSVDRLLQKVHQEVLEVFSAESLEGVFAKFEGLNTAEAPMDVAALVRAISHQGEPSGWSGRIAGAVLSDPAEWTDDDFELFRVRLRHVYEKLEAFQELHQPGRASRKRIRMAVRTPDGTFMLAATHRKSDEPIVQDLTCRLAKAARDVGATFDQQLAATIGFLDTIKDESDMVPAEKQRKRTSKTAVETLPLFGEASMTKKAKR